MMPIGRKILLLQFCVFILLQLFYATSVYAQGGDRSSSPGIPGQKPLSFISISLADGGKVQGAADIPAEPEFKLEFDKNVVSALIWENNRNCFSLLTSAGEKVPIRVTKVDDTAIKTVEDLQGKQIAVQIGTTGDLEASEIEGATVKRFNLAPDAIQEVRNGSVPACIIDLAVAEEIAKEYKDIKFGEPITTESYGIAIRKNNTELIQKINDGLASIKASGEYDEIHADWF